MYSTSRKSICVAVILVALAAATCAFATVPTAPTVGISPASAYVTSTLTVSATGSVNQNVGGNAPVYEYQWYKKAYGALVYSSYPNAANADFNGPFGPTLVGGAPNFVKGDSVYCVVRARVGVAPDYEYSAPVATSAVTIIDTAPASNIPAGLTLAPVPSPTAPVRGNDLTVTVAPALPQTDADGDTIIYTYQWYLNGAPTAYTTDTVPGSVVVKGQAWSVRVTAVQEALNGFPALTGNTVEAAVTVKDTPVTVPGAVNVLPTPPAVLPLRYAGLTASVVPAFDVDNDPITYEYKWLKLVGGVFVEQPAYTVPASSLTTATLPTGVVIKGDVWQCSVTAIAGGVRSAASISAPIVIGDTAPTACGASITPSNPVSPNTLTVNITSQSIDVDQGETPTYSYEWKYWNGVAFVAFNPAQTNTQLLAPDYGAGQRIICEVTATSGGASTTTVTTPVRIGDTAPPAPIVTAGPAAPAVVRIDGTLTGSITAQADADAGDPIPTVTWAWFVNSGAGFVQSALYQGTAQTLSAIGTSIPSAALVKGQQWKLGAYETTNSLTSNGGGWTYSNVITISDTAPTAATAAAILPAAPKTGDDLTASASGGADVDAADVASISYTFKWYKWNGTIFADSGLIGATLPNAATTKGEQWKVGATTLSAGASAAAEFLSAPVTIGNTAPNAAVQIALDSYAPVVGEAITATGVPGSDVDTADTVSLHYKWFKNIGGGFVVQPAYTDAVLPAGVTSLNEKWQVAIASFDGTAESADWIYSDVATVAAPNNAPTAPTSVTLSSSAPTTSMRLTALAAGSTDADGDALSYAYLWQKLDNGVWTDGPAGRVFAGTLVAGDIWRCAARARDAVSLSAWTYSDPVTIAAANAAPTRPATVTITPDAPRKGDNLTATASVSTDPEGAAVTYTFKWLKSVDGGAHWLVGLTVRNSATPTCVLPQGRTAVGQTWCCQVIASDGVNSSVARTSSSVTILAAPSAALVASASAAGTANGAAISVNLNDAADVTVSIVNLAGRVVATLGQSLPAGNSTLLWNGRGNNGTVAPSGRYFATIVAQSAGGASSTSSAAFSK